MEKPSSSQLHKEITLGKTERQNLLKPSHALMEGFMPHNVYYRSKNQSSKTNFQKINEFRMRHQNHSGPNVIPKKCFQVVEDKQLYSSETKNTFRKNIIDSFFKTKIVLNASAFQGFFCDLLIEHLSEELNFDNDTLNESLVQKEFVIVKQNDVFINHVTPVLKISDWNKHIKQNVKPRMDKTVKSIKWPSDEMENYILGLTCNLVPVGWFDEFEENSDYEKEWKIEFPKAEEYLLLHTMHAHLRFYFFLLAIYKSFLETETNSYSFGPKHLLHLLFWKIQKNFLAWSDDTLGETLLSFLKTLYKHLRNKFMPDFFFKSRNLFGNSYAKDLHKAQSVIKKILDNPVPYVMKAVSNLQLSQNFYQPFDASRLNDILKNYFTTTPPKTKTGKEKEIKIIPKTRSFELERETQWRKSIYKQMERDVGEEYGIMESSTESIDIETLPPPLHFDNQQIRELLNFFISHFLNMGFKSISYQDLDQAELYLYQINKLFTLFPTTATATTAKQNLQLESLMRKFKKLQENYFELKDLIIKNKKEFEKQNLRGTIESDGNFSISNSEEENDDLKFFDSKSNTGAKQCQEENNEIIKIDDECYSTKL